MATGEASLTAICIATSPISRTQRGNPREATGELSHSILEGKGKSMPAMKEKVASVGVMQMVALVREFRGGKLVIEDEEDRPPASEPLTTTPIVSPASPRLADVPAAPKMNAAAHKGTLCSNNSA